MSRIIYSGRVVSTKDPEGLGRVQVKLMGFEEEVELPWVRLVGPYASNSFGMVYLPEIDDEVVLLQGFGDALDHMVCLGSVYNGKLKPKYPDEDGKNNTKAITTRAGSEIVISDEDGKEKITIHTPDDELSMVMDHKEGTITITSTKKIVLDVPDGDVEVTCTTATVTASDAVNIEGTNKVDIKSSTEVSIEGSTAVNVKGADVKVEGSASVTIKGGAVQIN